MLDDYINKLKEGICLKSDANRIKGLREELKLLSTRSETLYKIENALGESLRKKADNRSEKLRKLLRDKTEKFNELLWTDFKYYVCRTVLKQLTEEES